MQKAKGLLILAVYLLLSAVLYPAMAQTDSAGGVKDTVKPLIKASPNVIQPGGCQSVSIPYITTSVSGTQCPGTSVTFTANATSSPAGTAIHYIWYMNGQGVGSDSKTFTTSLNSTASVYCNAYVEYMSGCTQTSETSSTTTMSIYTTPVLTLITGNSTVCAGTAGTYTTSSSDASSYSWSINPSSAGTISGSGSSVSITFASGFTGSATLSVTGSVCSLTSAPATLNITVLGPVGAASSPSGPSSACENGPVNFTTSAANATSYSWSINSNILAGSGASNSFFLPTNLTGNASITVTGSNMCGTGASASSPITIIPSVSAATPPSGPTQLCQGSAPSLYTTGTASNASGYVWSISPSSAGTINGSGTTASMTWNNSFNGSATVSVQASGCNASPAATSIVNILGPLGSPSAISGATTVSNSISGNITNTYTMTAANASGYTWSLTPANAGGISGSGSSATVSWSPLFSSNASICVTASGCTASAAATPLTVAVSLPLTAGAITPGALTLATGTSPGQLMVTPASGGSCAMAYTYTWQSSPDNASWTTVGTGSTYTPGALSSNTYYQVVVSCNGQTAPTSSAEMIIGAVSSDWNYVRTRDVSRLGIVDAATANGLTSPADVKQVTEYLDGLGRPIQEVAMKASPALNDMVSMHVYDAIGREPLKYLPYTSPTNDGNLKTDPFSEQQAFNATQFPNEQFFASETIYESSPLNRPLTTYAPGNSWAGSGRGTSTGYLLNADDDSVKLWTIGSAPESVPVVQGNYAAGTLYLTPTTDENGHQVMEYKDQQGKTLLKKVQLWDVPASGPSGWLNTYYVYDTLDNLRFVMPPNAVDWLKNNSWSFAASGGSTVAYELCFRYEYDYRQRMIIKKVPGAGESWMVYDTRDRMVMSQDSNLRKSAQWMVTRYDGLNRPVETGLINYSASQASMSSLVAGQNVNTSIGTSSDQVVLDPVPTGTSLQPQTFTYYDDYAWITGSGAALSSTFASSIAGSSNFITSYNTAPINAVPVTPLPVTRGEVTGSQELVLGSTSQYLSSVSFYDDRARLIQTYAINYTGGVDTVTTQYDFTGKPIRTLLGEAKSTNGADYHRVLTKTNYDPNFRVTSIWKNIDGASSDQIVDTMQYNELGQLRVKYLGKDPTTGRPLDSVEYDYNVRGWTLGINKDYLSKEATHYFGMDLRYDLPSFSNGASTSNPLQYNGNISGQMWKSAGDGIGRKYDYFYDDVNRLKKASFTQSGDGVAGWSAGVMNFSTYGGDNSNPNDPGEIQYDANGNILSMMQEGYKLGGSTQIDALAYTYFPNSNKLMQVYDYSNDTASQLGDFHYKITKSAGTSMDYHYDGNGNLTSDANKAIDTIVYNYLNLPQRVHMKGKGNILYTYDAAGNKLLKQVIDSVAGLATTTSYLDGFQYQRRTPVASPSGGTDTLQFMGHEEGRARWASHKYLNGDSAYAWEYDFVEKDHLGNTRVLLTQEKDTLQYIATMEAAYRTTENALFYGIDSSCVVRPAGYPDDLSVTTPNDSVSRVNGNGPSVGPAIVLRVMAGDKIDLGVQYYYASGSTTTNPPLSPQSLLYSFASGLAPLSPIAGESFSALSNPTGSPLLAALNSSISFQNGTSLSKPQAYLNWVQVDENFQVWIAGSIQVGAAGLQSNGQLQSPLSQTGIPISRTGFLYIYVSNSTPGWDVFFDNLSIKHYPGPMLEENHYYPFGLTMAGISDKAIKAQYQENKYRANGGDELQNKEFSDGSGLEAYDATFRMYDPQIGRFMQIDPLAIIAADYSPYSFVQDNPLSFSDPFGLTDSVVDVTNVGVKGVKAYAAAPVVTPGSPAPHKDVNVGIADTKGGGFSVSADPAPATVSSPIPGSQGSDNTAGNTDKGDHNIVTDIAYELNKFNPLAKVVDLGYTFFTGHDSYGVPQTKTGAVTNLAVTIPVFRAAEGVEIGANLIEQGLGSTGRTEAANLTEKLAMEEIKSNPALGARIANMKPLTDPRWQGWFKMTNLNAHGVEIHFNALIKDGVITAVDDFKFK